MEDKMDLSGYLGEALSPWAGGSCSHGHCVLSSFHTTTHVHGNFILLLVGFPFPCMALASTPRENSLALTLYAF